MKNIVLFGLFALIMPNLFGQKYFTQNGTISFYSEAKLEDIESTNSQVSSVIDLENGKVAFSLLMKAFTFEKALMQTHFNEKYVESELYPKATLIGKIDNLANKEITNEPQEFTIAGNLTIHGETREVVTKGTLYFNEKGQLIADSKFEILLSDYQIKIPSAVKDNLSETILIKIHIEYEKMD